ncbi:uncharacterized protein BP5553_10464 [Venustampulla echinocandica]|uniref:Uncharacterized protein n=1 Tax=Venustampulla echinocandica TaxID=2656787 RepID=A0A370T9D7_9HELO|nr:uncharacterized protein BP5553_10464 [Venustampulla echinocandica]RDL30186.1 hypothetical protein BP5553_10464 [Venustampulla echinocandica]
MSSKPHSSPSSDQHEAPQGSEKDDVKDEDLGELPVHLQSVRDGLLDFNHFMGLQAALLIAEETDEDFIPLSAYKPDGVGKLERARESEFVASAQNLAAYAKNIDAQDGYEWHKLFRAVMTGRIDSTSCGSSVHKNIAWVDNEIWRDAATFDLPKPPTTIPTSGLYFGFSVQKADQRAATGFRNDPSFDNYTREQLAQLTTQGLHSALPVPSSVDEAMVHASSKEPQPQLVCFPWGIFGACGVFKSPEAKDVSFASAVSQVFAAASTAISMFERLAKFADEKHDGQHIPPVIAITSVGASTTVWLAYCDIVDDKIRDHKIISIWEGTITKIWDAIQFCRIADNLFFWAQHCLKPKVTQYLSQWRLRYCPDVPKIYSLLEMDTKTAEIVHQIQDRLSSLGLSPNEDLPALVRQAVIFQEVMRWSNKEKKADSASKEQNKHSKATISLPSRPRDSSVEVALSSATGSQQGTDRKVCPREKEILHQDSDIMARKNEKCTAESSKPHNTHIFQPKSALKYQKATPALPHKGRESAGGNSTVLEDTKSEHPIRSLLSYNHQALTLYPATSSNVLTNKQALNSRSPIISDADGRGNDKISFSNQLQIKTSDAGEKKSPLPRPSKEPDDAYLNLPQRILGSMASRIENGHVLSLEKQKRKNLNLLLKGKKLLNIENLSKLSLRKDSDKENSSDRLSFSPNPFVSETFELSFEVTPWLDLDMAGPSLPTRNRHGPYPTLRIGAVEHMEYPRGTSFHLAQCRVDLAPQPIILEPLSPPPASPLKVKIPWKGKYIMVKLPPVDPPSVSIKRKSDSILTKDTYIEEWISGRGGG